MRFGRLIEKIYWTKSGIITVLVRKPEDETSILEIGKPAGNNIIATLSISLVGGILAMLLTMI